MPGRAQDALETRRTLLWQARTSTLCASVDSSRWASRCHVTLWPSCAASIAGTASVAAAAYVLRHQASGEGRESLTGGIGQVMQLDTRLCAYMQQRDDS